MYKYAKSHRNQGGKHGYLSWDLHNILSKNGGFSGREKWLKKVTAGTFVPAADIKC